MRMTCSNQPVVMVCASLMCLTAGLRAQSPGPAPAFRLVTLDPGHFHASLVQKFMYGDVDSVVNVFAPAGDDVAQHLMRIDAFNKRAEAPTHWVERVYTGADFLERMLALRLHLDPVTDENGPLKVIPGSHLMSFDRSRFDESLFFRGDLPENQAVIANSVPVELDSGDVLFFHAKTLHSASRNHTTQTKYSAVFTFRAASNLPLPGTRSAELPELMLPEA